MVRYSSMAMQPPPSPRQVLPENSVSGPEPAPVPRQPQPPTSQLCSKTRPLPSPANSTLWTKNSSVPQLSQEVITLNGQGKYVLEGGELLIWTEVPCLVPDWSILMQTRAPNPRSLVGPQDTVLVGQNRGNSDYSELPSSDGSGKASVLLAETGLQEVPYQGCSAGWTQRGRQPSTGCSLA